MDDPKFTASWLQNRVSGLMKAVELNSGEVALILAVLDRFEDSVNFMYFTSATIRQKIEDTRHALLCAIGAEPHSASIDQQLAWAYSALGDLELKADYVMKP